MRIINLLFSIIYKDKHNLESKLKLKIETNVKREDKVLRDIA